MAYATDVLHPSNLSSNITSNDSYCDYYPDCDFDVYAPLFQLTTGKILSAIGIAILIVVALIGNILVCVAFCQYKRLRTVPNYFIVSLAVSDIMVSAFSMPLWLSYEVTGWEQLPAWMDYFVLHKYWQCIDILSCVSSIANLAAISLDRLFSIIAPLRHRTRMTPVVALIMIAFAWLYAFTISLCSLTGYRDYTIISAAFGFFLPLQVIISSYMGIYIKFRIRSSRQGAIVGDWNLERTLLIVIGLFVFCWLPFFTFTLLYHYCLSCEFTHETTEYMMGFTKWMHYFNSCCNPIVYGFCNINFKTAFWALLGSCFSKRYSDMNLAPCSRETSNSQAGTVLRHLKSIKRKLSWKREVEESIVSNGGEVNDNSLSLAMLALQLKNGRDVESQESQALMETSDSRPSSKASEDIGLLCDEWSSTHESSGDEAAVIRSNKDLPFHYEAESCKRSAQSKPIEFTNKTYGSVYGDDQSHKTDSDPTSIRQELGLDTRSVKQEELRLVPVNIDGNLKQDVLDKFASIPTKRKWLNEIDYFESEDSTSEYGEKLVQFDSRESSPSSHDFFGINETQHKHKRSGRAGVAVVDIAGDIADIDRDDEMIIKEDMIDTKESIV